MEARTLQGLVLGMLPVNDFSDYLTHLSRWVRVIHSWSVCDSFSLPHPKKLLREHGPELWAFFLPYLQHSGEYEVRFGIVALMQYFIDDEHIDELLRHYLAVSHEGYYVRMALAWLSLSATPSTPPRPTLTSLRSASSRGCTTRPSRRSASRAASIPTPRPYSRPCT